MVPSFESESPPDRESSGYFLDIPSLKSNLSDDIGLSQYVHVVLSNGISTPKDENMMKKNRHSRHDQILSDLERFGRRCVLELDPLADEMERNQPELKRYQLTGQSRNEVLTSTAWDRMKTISCEEGLVRIGYEEIDELCRLHQFVKLHMLSSCCGLMNCPLAMTDGCCKLAVAQAQSKNKAKNHAEEHKPGKAFLSEVFERFITKKPKDFWTCGQWMTERGGGSDVQNGTHTIATPVEGKPGVYTLKGYKWFSSAADGEVSVTLARINGQKS